MRLADGRADSVTPLTRQMVATMAAAVSEPLRSTLEATLDGKRADDAFPMLGALSRVLEPSLRHMVNPTVVRGGEKSNVIPSEITLDLDVRLLPGFGTEDVVPELQAIVVIADADAVADRLEAVGDGERILLPAGEVDRRRARGYGAV